MESKQEMRARIEQESIESSTQRSMLEALVKPGMILRVAPRHFVLVIAKSKIGESFYYTPCSLGGELKMPLYSERSAANFINNSVMLRDSDKIEVVNQIALETHVVFHNCKRYQWQLTGHFNIDAYMSHLDERYSLFIDTCNDAQSAKYAELEDKNCHTDNGHFVKLHAQFFKESKLKQLKSKAV